jgi:hypothetical protein
VLRGRRQRHPRQVRSRHGHRCRRGNRPAHRLRLPRAAHPDTVRQTVQALRPSRRYPWAVALTSGRPGALRRNADGDRVEPLTRGWDLMRPLAVAGSRCLSGHVIDFLPEHQQAQRDAAGAASAEVPRPAVGTPRAPSAGERGRRPEVISQRWQLPDARQLVLRSGSAARTGSASCRPSRSHRPLPAQAAGPACTTIGQLACSMIAVDHVCRSETAGGCRGHCGRRLLRYSVLHARGGTLAGVPVCQHAQLTIAAGSGCQHHRCSRAPDEVVAVPERPPADPGG